VSKQLNISDVKPVGYLKKSYAVSSGLHARFQQNGRTVNLSGDILAGTEGFVKTYRGPNFGKLESIYLLNSSRNEPHSIWN